MKKTKLVLSFMKPHKIKFTILLSCIITTTFLASVFPYFFGRLVDEVFREKNMSIFLEIVSLYALVYIINQLLHLVLNITWAKLKTGFLYDIRKAMFIRVLGYKGKTLSSLHSGDIISRMDKDVEQFMSLIHWNIFYSVARLLSLVIALGFIFYYNMWLAVLTVVLAPISVYLSTRYANKVKKVYAKLSTEKGLLSSWLFEIIKGMEDIRILSATRRVVFHYITGSSQLSRLKIKADKVEVTSERMNAGILLLGQLSLYTVSALLINSGDLTIGGFVACVGYFATFTGVLKGLNGRASAISGNIVGLERVMETLAEEIESDTTSPDNDKKVKKGSIAFKDVHFGYSDEIKVLKGINFEIKPGEMVSVVGHSGEGKSTIANIIMKIYDIGSGQVLIDDESIEDFSHTALRAQIGMVHQEAFLFEGSIRYNIIFRDCKEQDEALMAVLESVRLKDVIDELPEGLDTIIGSKGAFLSGGQKQRLTIARIIMKDPSILIFDESTSALDSETEGIIHKALGKLTKNRTTLVIAHRLSTIIGSDKVLVVKNGVAVGFDTHKTLLDNNNVYQGLFKEQYFVDMEGA